MPAELEQWLSDEEKRRRSNPNTESWRLWLEKQALVKAAAHDIYKRTQALFETDGPHLSETQSLLGVFVGEEMLGVKKKKGRLVNEKEDIWEPVYVFTRFSRDSETHLFISSPGAVSNSNRTLLKDMQEFTGIEVVLNQIEGAIYPKAA